MVARNLLLTLLFLVPAYLYLNQGVWSQREMARSSAEAGYVIPSKYSRILALEHKGLVADYLLLKTILFFGERVVHGQSLSEEDWVFIIGSLDAVTDLDPYFLDPYILAEGLLTWESEKYDEANRLLKKGMEYRANDWLLPFFVGFNYFYFLGDNERGSEYLRTAAALPGSPSFLPDLAARISYYGGKSREATVFLRGIIDQTHDPKVKKRLERRLLALERAAWLEELVERFKSDLGRPPENIRELVSQGYVDVLPEDPYGGEWIILDNGRVFSESRFLP